MPDKTRVPAARLRGVFGGVNVQKVWAHVHTQGLRALPEAFVTCSSTFCFSGLGFLTFWLQFMLAARLTEVSRSVSL